MIDLTYPDHLVKLFTDIDNMTDEQRVVYYNKLQQLPSRKHDQYTQSVIDYVHNKIQGIELDLGCCNKYD